MGKGKRVVPKNLPEKLKTIRFELDLSLEKMVEALEGNWRVSATRRKFVFRLHH
jgi:hypothetical protein